jgi:hypothetical protein
VTTADRKGGLLPKLPSGGSIPSKIIIINIYKYTAFILSITLL